MSENVSGIFEVPRPVRDLATLSAASERLEAVRREDLEPGDRVVVATRNSMYALTARADGRFVVAGGWFNRQHEAPVDVVLAGCTAGGSAILGNVVAAPGLFLEFGNGVRTTRIRHVRHFKGGEAPA
jgi:hypothetical protein